MQTRAHAPHPILGINRNPIHIALGIMLMLLFFIFIFLFLTLTAQPAHGQTYKVLYTFTGWADGANPRAGLTMDAGGNLYGTAYQGGPGGDGTVYRLKRSGANWVFDRLYIFPGGSGGAAPWGGVVFGPDGALYGTTTADATVFGLRPQPKVCYNALCLWMHTVLHGLDSAPLFGSLIFDPSGNIYNTTVLGGLGVGSVFELTPSGGDWTETVVYNFSGSGSDGWAPYHGVVRDDAGNLYGTTLYGGDMTTCANYGCGTVFRLTPSGTGWTQDLLHRFQGGDDGAFLYAGLIAGPSGNLYGATNAGGPSGGGTVFELTPSGDGWTYSVIYRFTGECFPVGNLVIDPAGNLYGTCSGNGYVNGSVFKLTPSVSSWTYTSLHDFAGGSDGVGPMGDLMRDASGNLYGTTYAGGSSNCDGGCGVVWEVTP